MQSENPWYIQTAELAEMLFPEAGELWLASRTPYISPKTFREYELNLRTLGRAFGETKLREITADQIRVYQAMRTSQKCGPSGVNHECSVLQQMLKRIGKWDETEPQYQALRLLDRGPGRVLSPDERTRLFQMSARKENWEGAFLFAVLSINTSAGPKEILTLRLKDVDLKFAIIVCTSSPNLRNIVGDVSSHTYRPIDIRGRDSILRRHASSTAFE